MDIPELEPILATVRRSMATSEVTFLIGVDDFGFTNLTTVGFTLFNYPEFTFTIGSTKNTADLHIVASRIFGVVASVWKGLVDKRIRVFYNEGVDAAIDSRLVSNHLIDPDSIVPLPKIVLDSQFGVGNYRVFGLQFADGAGRFPVDVDYSSVLVQVEYPKKELH